MPENSHSLFRRKRTVLFAALAVIVLLAVFGTRFFGGYDGPLETRPAQETIGWPFDGFFGSAASGVMHRLGIPAMSSDPSPIESRPADGNAPEFFATSFSSRSSLEEIKQYYQASCQGLELKVLPPKTAYGLMPEIYCEGRYKGRIAAVFVGVNCSSGLCDVSLNVEGTR